MLKSFWMLFYFEMLLLIRRAQEWLYPIAFFVIVITLLPFAFSPDPEVLRLLVPGGIWIAALFACMLSVETIFQMEKEENTLKQWMLGNLPLAMIILAKITAHWICGMLPLVLLAPLISSLLQLPLAPTLVLTLSLLLGTPILMMLGCLGAALTSGLRQQGVMLSLIILPLASPVLIFGVNMVLQTNAGFSPIGPLALLAGILVVCVLAIPFAAAEAIRIGEDD